MNETIYKVTTEGDVEGKSIKTLGYCTGKVPDIKDFFEDKKAYNIYVEPINVIHISSTSTQEKRRLIEDKKRLEAELKIINNKIG